MATTSVPRRGTARRGGSPGGNRKQSGSFLFPALVCTAGGGLVSGIAAALFALAFSMIDLPELAVTAGALAALVLGALVTGRLCGLAFPEERGIMALICGLVLVLILVVLNLIFFREPVTAFSFAKYGAVLLPAFLAAVLTRNRRKKSKKRLKKR